MKAKNVTITDPFSGREFEVSFDALPNDIVRAVNNYDLLKASHEELVKALKYAEKVMREGAERIRYSDGKVNSDLGLEQASKDIKQALTNAGKGE
jgi:hypothetical protein